MEVQILMDFKLIGKCSQMNKWIEMCFMRSFQLLLFVFLQQVKANCSEGCTVCYNGGQQCLNCSQGYWLNSGKCEKCPDNCLECQLGKCTVCKEMFYNLAASCTYRCSMCDESGCDDTGICYSCRQGYYGEYCQNDCGHCINRQCSRQQCVLGCELGYDKLTINNINHCFPCPTDCNLCSNTTFCTQCKNGYYKHRFISSNGYGYVNCISCESSSVCTQCQYISNCLQCSVTNGVLVCDICKDGFVSVGSSCEPLKCISGCFDKCDENGNCIDGCKDGYTGSSCTYRCFEHCTRCNQTNQNYCEKCIDGYYTQSCNAKCNPNCKIVPEMPTCSINDGSCMNGCNRGFWGIRCQYTCSSNCFDNTFAEDICQNNGSCTYGCKRGFSAADCNAKSTSSSTIFTPTGKAKTETSLGLFTGAFTTSQSRSTDTLSQEKGLSSGAIIGGAVAGAIVIISLTVGVTVVFLRKRSSSKKQNAGEETGSTYYNMSLREPTSFQNSVPSEKGTYDKLTVKCIDHEYSGLDKTIIEQDEATADKQDYYNCSSKDNI